MPLAYRGSLAQFRAEQVGRVQAPIYRPLRYLTTPVSWRLAELGLSPNIATAVGALFAIAAMLVFASGRSGSLLLGSVFVFGSYLCDCMDGELARLQERSSPIGGQLDQLTNWMTMVGLQIGLAVGVYRATGQPVFLFVGMLAVGGWCTFYYLYLQLAQWVSASAEFHYLRRFSRVLFLVMPLDENLVLLTGLIGQPTWGLLVSGALSATLTLIVCTLFLGYSLRPAPERRASELNEEV